MDEGDRRGVDRLTIQEAARALGISEGAIRKRVTRGTLKHEKEQDGRIYVYLDAWDRRGVDSGQDEGVDPNSNALISQLRDEVAYLRDENRRKDEIIMQQAMTMRQLSAAQPQEPTQAPETVEEEPERTEPRPGAGVAQEDTERPQQRSGWRAPVEKLPWWQYLLGLFLVTVASYLSEPLAEMTLGFGMPVGVRDGTSLLIEWLPAGVFGVWVGFRRRNLRFRSQIIPFGILVGLADLLGSLVSLVQEYGSMAHAFDGDVWYATGFISGRFLPAWLLFVSTSLVGHAWQRRRTERIYGTTPASAAPRRDWSIRQQAFLGWSGTIIAALISLVGTIISSRGGP